MSNMRHLLEFRHREFATFLRSRGTLPSSHCARPRSRIDHAAPAHPPTTSRTSAIPLPPLPALPSASKPHNLSNPPLTFAAPPKYRPSVSAPLPQPAKTIAVANIVTPALPAHMRTSTLVGNPKVSLPVKTEPIVTSARTASFAKSDVASARKRPREVSELITPSGKRRKDIKSDAHIVSPTGIAANVITPGKSSESEYDPTRSSKEPVTPGVATRSSSEQTEDVDEASITPGFDCELCASRFYRKHHLERHIQSIHERQRPWTCDRCGFAFHQKPNLERHIMTVHQDQKPFRCELCDMSFGRKGVLKKHVQMVHEHSRKFECELCPNIFGLKSDLKRHVQSVHQKKRPFVCEVCSASFGRRSDLKRHTLSLHPGVEVPTGKNSGPSRQNVS